MIYGIISGGRTCSSPADKRKLTKEEIEITKNSEEFQVDLINKYLSGTAKALKEYSRIEGEDDTP